VPRQIGFLQHKFLAEIFHHSPPPCHLAREDAQASLFSARQLTVRTVA
jgi:hypothetical protein